MLEVNISTASPSRAAVTGAIEEVKAPVASPAATGAIEDVNI
jgi:hypothetical protein